MINFEIVYYSRKLKFYVVSILVLSPMKYFKKYETLHNTSILIQIL